MLPRRQTAHIHTPYPSRDGGQHRLFQTPPPPPFPPPHAQPLMGHPVGGQYHTTGLPLDVPQAYAQPYGAPFYGPMYPPLPLAMQYPQVIPQASVGIGHFPSQPWGYAHHPMAQPPAPVPYPVAMHPRETGAPFLEDRRACTDRRRAEPGESGGPSAAAVSTQGGQIKKIYPNNQLSEGGKWYSLWLKGLTLMSSSLGVHG
ncbi:hypothetical protein EDB92DRAFT_1507020 [Lactarius akahatsu]|uniref:DAZ-associated protein 2 n=1 Tax=Lactarius akahatsu TaxID=416441 RepID=A0AAD4LN83_9AGAM|nr:hypothetical protein EDB92DRAFT_1507020 [Lactarius akahatsu]